MFCYLKISDHKNFTSNNRLPSSAFKTGSVRINVTLERGRVTIFAVEKQ